MLAPREQLAPVASRLMADPLLLAYTRVRKNWPALDDTSAEFEKRVRAELAYRKDLDVDSLIGELADRLRKRDAKNEKRVRAGRK